MRTGLRHGGNLSASSTPKNAEVHAAQLGNIVSFGIRTAFKSLGDVPTVLDQFRRVLDDYDEVTGECGINDSIKKTIMMQFLPPSLKIATRDT